MRSHLSKSATATLAQLVAIRNQRERRRQSIRATLEAVTLLALFVAMLLWSREGHWMRECPIWAQALTWYAWLCAAFAWWMARRGAL